MTDKKFNPKWKGQPIKNQPNWYGEETGRYFIDHHGCWHEVLVTGDKYGAINNPNDLAYMIGEYPEL